MTIPIEIERDWVKVCGQIVYRPKSVVPGTWLSFWDDTQDDKTEYDRGYQDGYDDAVNEYENEYEK